MCVCVLGGKENAAVGQLEPGLEAQRGEAARSVGPERDLVDAEVGDEPSGDVEATLPGRSDEHFREREGAGAERPIGVLQKSLHGSRMLRVVLVEMGDQHAGVDDDHAGQSSRSRSR